MWARCKVPILCLAVVTRITTRVIPATSMLVAALAQVDCPEVRLRIPMTELCSAGVTGSNWCLAGTWACGPLVCVGCLTMAYVYVLYVLR
jgi:hypothetical protein